MSHVSEAADRPSPSTGADITLAAALLGVLIGLSWGVTWVQGAAAGGGNVTLWHGVIPPLASALGGFLLLRVRSVYGALPRLCRFLTRTGTLGLVGGALLAVSTIWIAAH